MLHMVYINAICKRLTDTLLQPNGLSNLSGVQEATIIADNRID